MSRVPAAVLVLLFNLLLCFRLVAQEDSGWRISPEKINLQMGDDRALQALDDSAQELHGAQWSVDRPDLADLREEGNLAVLHAKAVGTVVVSATLNGEMRFREIKIWSALRALPPGTTNWGLHPIGREIGDLPAVPTPDGPTVYSLEQTAAGDSYLRADREDGIQVWTWLMPEKTSDVELVCGDWMGGALISANRGDSFTLYTVGKDGKLRWQHEFAGVRKGHAYNLQHLVHILSQSLDGTVTHLTGLDEESGVQKFELTLPASHEKLVNVGHQGVQVVCTSKSATNPLRSVVSHLMVNMDGYAYVAFSQNDWTLTSKSCTAGSVLDPHELSFVRDEKLLLWQVHPDGTYRSSVVETTKITQTLSAPVSSAFPTGAIVTDNMNGTLVPVGFSHVRLPENLTDPADEYVYRVDEEGEVVYKYPLPKYEGRLNDEMVIGNDDVAFATRGGTLIAFNVRTGKDLWRWDSNTPEISVFAALANGDCAVQTPTALVEVGNGTKPKELLKGKAMMGWQGQMFRKHN